MKKILFFTVLFLTVTLTSFAKTDFETKKFKSANLKSNYFEIIYEIRLLNDGCFHLMAFWENGTVIIYGDDLKAWGSRGIFGCIANFDEFC